MQDNITEQIINQTDIVEVISEYVDLKKRGKNFVGLCPFHNEKTPSFNVSPELGIFKCFGCGKTGNVITFLIEYNGMSFIEAKRELARRLGVSIEYENKSEKSKIKTKRELILDVLEKAASFFSYSLNLKSGAVARQYIAKRGFTQEIVNKFNLGYAPDQWDSLHKTLINKGISENILLEAGLIIEKDNGGYYDRFRNRLIFPIKNQIGKIVGFGGRTLSQDNKQAKYINSPQTIVYDKSNILYGLYEAKREIIDKKYVILVEGYADVLTLHQAGIINVVASSGTSLTKDQVNLLRKFCNKIYFVFDSDIAGQKATDRGIEIALESGFSVYVVTLPSGEDPDSFIRNYSKELFLTFLNSASSFIDFKTELFKKDGLLNSPEGIAQSARELVRIVSLIPDVLQHDILLNKITYNLKLSKEQLQILYNEKKILGSEKVNILKSENEVRIADVGGKRSVTKSFGNEKLENDLINKLLAAERLLFQLILTQKETFEKITKKSLISENDLATEEARKIFQLISTYKQKSNILNEILMDESIESNLKEIIASIAFQETESENWSKFTNFHKTTNTDRIIEDVITNLKIHKLDIEIQNLKNELKIIGVSGNSNQLITMIQRLQQKKLELQKKLDFVEKRSQK